MFSLTLHCIDIGFRVIILFSCIRFWVSFLLQSFTFAFWLFWYIILIIVNINYLYRLLWFPILIWIIIAAIFRWSTSFLFLVWFTIRLCRLCCHLIFTSCSHRLRNLIWRTLWIIWALNNIWGSWCTIIAFSISFSWLFTFLWRY